METLIPLQDMKVLNHLLQWNQRLSVQSVILAYFEFDLLWALYYNRVCTYSRP